MLAPALIYLSLNLGGIGEPGWGIPMATDIAFALGALALLGNRVPPGVLVFLTALAIVDDLGAVVVIALFYGGEVSLEALLSGGIILAVSFLLAHLGVRSTMVYVVLGVLLWLAFLTSGVHATVAGILMAMTIPTNALLTANEFADRIQRLLSEFLRRERVDNPLLRAEEQQAIIQEMEIACHQVEAPLQDIEHNLHPWVTYAIMPVFAFANAGVEIDIGSLHEALLHPITMGIILGLVLGKQIGILLFSWVPVKLGLADLPAGTTWWHIYGVSWLAGIGFTMSLFIGSLAFVAPELLTYTKIGIVTASLLSGVIGYGVLHWALQDPSIRASDG